MARLTLVTLSFLFSTAALVGVAFALAGRSRIKERRLQQQPRTCPVFELLMQ